MPFNILEKELTLSTLRGADNAKKEVKGDIKVPEELGTLNIISAFAVPKNIRTSIDENRCMAEGDVNFYVIYGREGTTDGFDLAVPFDVSMEVEPAEGETYTKGKIRAVNPVAVVKGNVIECACEVDFECEVWEKNQINYVDEITHDDRVRIRKNTKQYYLPVVMKEDEQEVFEAAYISSVLPPVSKLLSVQLAMRDERYEYDDEMLIYTCNILVDSIYKPQGGDEIEYCQTTVPFVYKTELPEKEMDAVKVFAQVRDYKIEVEEDSDGERKVLGFSGQVGVNVEGWKTKEFNEINDVYGLDSKLELLRVENQSHRNLYLEPKKVEARGIVASNIKGEYTKGLCIWGSPEITNVSNQNGQINIEGCVKVRVLYSTEREEQRSLGSTEGTVEFNCVVQDPENAEGTIYSYAKLDGLSFSMASASDFEARALVDVYTGKIVSSRSDFPVAIEEAEYEESEEEKPDILIYNSLGGEYLWDIAKKYRTSEERLEEINKIDKTAMIKKDQSIVIY